MKNTRLADNLLTMEHFPIIIAIGLTAGACVLVGYWLVNRVSSKQARENRDHIADLRETIRVLRKDKRDS